ncbi:MAG: hypothetical protein QXL09_02750 [Candidatus Aenigmatarchaeota archaeon]
MNEKEKLVRIKSIELKELEELEPLLVKNPDLIEENESVSKTITDRYWTLGYSSSR